MYRELQPDRRPALDVDARVSNDHAHMFDVSHANDPLTNPAWLLTGFDVDARRFAFVETSRDILLSSAFIDGRTPLSFSNRIATAELREATAWRRSVDAPPLRIIAHVGFCGSSLLAHALDETGVCLTFKEPQAITDLSGLKTNAHPITRADHEWRQIVDLTASQFVKAFPGLTSVLKLSNWPVNLLPDLCALDSRIVFLTTSPRDYLLAILRGGRERSWFMLQFMQKLRRDFSGVDEAIAGVEKGVAGNSWQLILRGSLVALAAQEQLFARVSAELGSRSVTLQSEALMSTPDETLEIVANTLELPIRRVHRRRAIRAAFASSSKQPWAKFDAAAHAGSNERLLKLFAGEIEEALQWRARNNQRLV